MSLETKGTIKYDPDVKASVPEYIISVKQLGITAEGSGNVEQMIKFVQDTDYVLRHYGKKAIWKKDLQPYLRAAGVTA